MAAARIRWDRIGRWALLAVIALVAYLYVGPARTWWSTYAEAKRKRADVAELRDRHDELLAHKRRLKRADALETEARKLGMVKAGEKLYVVK
jgi:cell division protein FtsB